MLIFSGTIQEFVSPEKIDPYSNLNCMVRLEDGILIGFKKNPFLDSSSVEKNTLKVGTSLLVTGSLKESKTQKQLYIFSYDPPFVFSDPPKSKFNEIYECGYVGSKPTVKNFQDGKIHSFPFFIKDGKESVLCNVSLFNKEKVSSYLEKGKLIAIKGVIKINQKEEKTFINIVGSHITFLSKGSNSEKIESNSEKIESSTENSIPF